MTWDDVNPSLRETLRIVTEVARRYEHQTPLAISRDSEQDEINARIRKNLDEADRKLRRLLDRRQ
jgi:hypothetical protein